MTCEAQPSPQGQPPCPLVCVCNGLLLGLSTQECLSHTRFRQLIVCSTLACLGGVHRLALPYMPCPPWVELICCALFRQALYPALSSMLVDTLHQLPDWSLPFLLCPLALHCLPVTIALCLSPSPFACHPCPLPVSPSPFACLPIALCLSPHRPLPVSPLPFACLPIALCLPPCCPSVPSMPSGLFSMFSISFTLLWITSVGATCREAAV